jgi:non-heme chloroperoxidase
MSTATERMSTHTVTGADGLRLHVREWGDPAGPPIVFIHGMSASHACWARQYQSRLADHYRLVAYDLRGHGMSDKPVDPCRYAEGSLWAGDLAAVMDGLGVDRPVLVGWSYGSAVICDYVRARGQDRIAAIDLVAPAAKLGPAAFGTLIGPGFLDHWADLVTDDIETNIRGLRAFLRACVAMPLEAEIMENALCWNMVVPAKVRANLGGREIDDDAVLRTLDVPVLVTQGRADTVVLPAMTEHILATCPAAQVSWYDGVGHMPQLEQPDRFNAELAALVERVGSRSLGER